MENNNNNINNKTTTPSTSFDHLFDPQKSSSSLLSSIFPPPSGPGTRDHQKRHDVGGAAKNEKPENFGHGKKGETSGVTSRDSKYQNETSEPSYFSSSIHYGGQENYSPTTKSSHEPQRYFKRDGNDDDSNENSASRGNWWKGGLYY